MQDDEFTKLFRYMQQRFDELAESKVDKSDIDGLKSDLNRILKHLDALRTVTDDELERASLSQQVDEDWIHRTSTTTGSRYSNGS